MPLRIDDRKKIDDLAGDFRVHQDGVKVGAVALLLDLVPQIEKGIVDLADGAEDVLFEKKREVLIVLYGVAIVAGRLVLEFQGNAGPQHRDHGDAEHEACLSSYPSNPTPYEGQASHVQKLLPRSHYPTLYLAG